MFGASEGMAATVERMDLAGKMMRLFILDQGGRADVPFALDVERPIDGMAALLAMLLEEQARYAGDAGAEAAFESLREQFVEVFNFTRDFKRDTGMSPLALLETEFAKAA